MSDNYAFGNDYVADVPCPAIAAGFTPRSGDNSSEVASRYDCTIRTREHPDEERGIVDEQTAKSRWLGAINEAENLGYDDEAEVGREIAQELGWL